MKLKILFIFEDFKLVWKNKFKDKKIDIDDKREISIISIKLNWSRIFKWKFKIGIKKNIVPIIKINTANIFNINFEPYDLFLNVS